MSISIEQLFGDVLDFQRKAKVLEFQKGNILIYLKFTHYDFVDYTLLVLLNNNKILIWNISILMNLPSFYSNCLNNIKVFLVSLWQFVYCLIARLKKLIKKDLTICLLL